MRQLIVELVKEEVIGKLKNSLEYVIDQENSKIHDDAEMSEEDKEKAEKKLNYLEFELVEKLEYIKKKI